MIALKWLLSPFAKVFGLIVLVLGVIGTIYTKGRLAGKNAERVRSQKKVSKVQKKMDEETAKDMSTEELKAKLKNGGF